jgi:hypothetical protein
LARVFDRLIRFVGQRLVEILRRLGQADGILRRQGEEPQPFLLIYAAGGSVGIKHPAWDSSWPKPVAEDIDDLEELGFVRNHSPGNTKRVFSLTVRGRKQAAVFSEPQQTTTGGRAPSLDEIVAWLIQLEAEAPEILELPSRLTPRAIEVKFIDQASREAFASRIVDLVDQGYLTGDLPDLEQANAEQRLGLSDGLRLTMKAHDRVNKTTEIRPAINFNGSVIAGQIAAGSITNYLSFGDLLDDAAAEIDKLEQVEPAAREEAHRLIDLLRGKAADASGLVLTGAGGQLLGAVIGQLIGLSPAT